jgi:putative ABC transport system permease protein
MFSYYLELASEGLRRNRVLTLLLILAIGLGIGASMTMITVIHVMTADPIPGQSDTIFFPYLKPGPAEFERASGADTGDNLTWIDATNLLRDKKADQQAMMVGARAAIRTDGAEAAGLYARGRYTTSQFFALFNVPFTDGAGWDDTADQQRGRQIVLSHSLAEHLFGTSRSAVGRTVVVEGHNFQVAGILDTWHPKPLFYASTQGDAAFTVEDEFFLPITTAMDLQLPIAGGMTCWSTDTARTGSGCAWLQYWVKLSSPLRVSEFQEYLKGYWKQQSATNRPLDPAPPTLQPLATRMQLLKLVPTGVSMQLWLAIGFLAVCILNSTGLLLAKFLARRNEVSIRRAMGASRAQVVTQFLVEAAVTGLAGGIAGVFATMLGLWAVRHRPDGYAQLARLDSPMLIVAIGLSILATLLAGLLPAWKAANTEPALELKG